MTAIMSKAVLNRVIAIIASCSWCLRAAQCSTAQQAGITSLTSLFCSTRMEGDLRKNCHLQYHPAIGQRDQKVSLKVQLTAAKHACKVCTPLGPLEGQIVGLERPTETHSRAFKADFTCLHGTQMHCGEQSGRAVAPQNKWTGNLSI